MSNNKRVLKELYKKPRLIILPNPKNKNYIVRIKDDIIGEEDSGVYEVITFIQMGENGLEFKLNKNLKYQKVSHIDFS